MHIKRFVSWLLGRFINRKKLNAQYKQHLNNERLEHLINDDV